MFDGMILTVATCLGIFCLEPTMSVAKAVMAPINSLAKIRKGRVSVALIDVCCLIPIVQLSLAPLALGNSDRALLLPVAMLFATWLIFGWWRGVVKLSRIGVVQSSRRAALLLYVVPVTQLWLFAFIALLLTTVPILQHEAQHKDPLIFARAGLFIGGPAAVAVAALWLAYRTCCWIARGATPCEVPKEQAGTPQNAP